MALSYGMLTQHKVCEVNTEVCRDACSFLTRCQFNETKIAPIPKLVSASQVHGSMFGMWKQPPLGDE